MFCYINGTNFRRLSLSEPLISVGLSARAYNALASNDIRTIKDLLVYPREGLAELHGLGRTSIAEIQEYLAHLYSYPSYHKLYPLTEETAALLGLPAPKKDAVRSSFDVPEELKRKPLGELGLTTRAYNALKDAGYKTIGDLASATTKDLLDIRNFGRGSAKVVAEALKRISAKQSSAPAFVVITSGPASSECINFYKNVLQREPIDDIEHFRAILQEFEQAYEQGRPVDYYKLYEDNRLRHTVVDLLVKYLEDHPFGIDKEEAFSLLPDRFMVPAESLDNILAEMEDARLIRIQDKITLCRMSVLELANIVQDPRLKDMLRQRLHGVPLKRIAKQYNISLERARQIISKGIKQYQLEFEENKYIPIFKTYLFSKEQFMYAFEERAEVYHYLCIVCPKRKRPYISKFEDDPSLPIEVRQGIYRLFAPKCLNIAGEEIERDRNAITKHVVRTYFKEGGTFPDLYAKYRQALKAAGADGDSKLLPASHNYINHLRRVDFLLWEQGQRFRYYEINERDYTELLEALDFEQYKDVEYSARRFFLDQPALMEKYDIRDEYELHNLLRKVYEKKDRKGIVFKRMPIIAFGKADRIHQVYEVLLELSPVSQQDFMKYYEKAYGLEAETLAQYYLGPFMKYSFRGIYDVRGISEERIREEAAASSR